MPDGIRWVGLDVHARESTLAVCDQGTGEVLTRRVVGRPHELLPLLLEVPRPARMVYEAGPTGYGLARRARAEGIEVAVSAPGKTDRPPSGGRSYFWTYLRERPPRRHRRRCGAAAKGRRGGYTSSKCVIRLNSRKRSSISSWPRRSSRSMLKSSTANEARVLP